MIYTQRQSADQEFDKIKTTVKDSRLCFFLEETPFSPKFHIKKKYLQDFSTSDRSTSSTPTISLGASFYNTSNEENNNAVHSAPKNREETN